MEKTVIFCFSGTGNTLRICKLFKERLERQGAEVVLKTIPCDAGIALEYDSICIAYPVHAFNAPEPVLRFARTLPRSNGQYVFTVKTSGEPLKLNDASGSKLDLILKKSGYTVGREFHYVMPYNIIFRHSDGFAAKLLETAKQRIDSDVESVIKKEYVLRRQSFCNKALAAAFRIEQPFVKMNGRLFSVDKNKCGGCGKCARECPCGNIEMKDNLPSFGKNCSACMRCAFLCPNDAVRTGILQPLKINGAYDFDGVNPQKAELPRYCRRSYAGYFTEENETKALKKRRTLL